jgi:hypothetical protein
MNNIKTNEMIAEFWETPIIDPPYLWLSQQLFTRHKNYFFFEIDFNESTNPTYVMSISNSDTFKITDETESGNRIDQYTKNMRGDSSRKRGLTYKAWNTPFAIEVCSSLIISEEEYYKMEKLQYIIATLNQNIEFVTFDPPKWEFYEGIKLEDLVIQYVKKDA